MINIQTTPIVSPMIIPITIPRPREETELSDEIFVESLRIISVSGIIEGIFFKTGSPDSISKSFCEITSDEIFENFAASVIDSVVEFPPNNVECVKRV